MIIASFKRVVYPLKYPSNAYLSFLDNGYCCWNVVYLERQNVISVLPVIGQVSYQNKTQIPLRYQSIANMPLFK